MPSQPRQVRAVDSRCMQGCASHLESSRELAADEACWLEEGKPLQDTVARVWCLLRGADLEQVSCCAVQDWGKPLRAGSIGPAGRRRLVQARTFRGLRNLLAVAGQNTQHQVSTVREREVSMR